MNLIRYNPNRWFDFPFDRFFDEWLPRNVSESEAQSTFAPRVDIQEDNHSVIVSAELPGVDKDKLSVELENGVLTLTGEKKTERTDEEAGFYRSERVYGTFKRSFKVPNTVNPEAIAAEYVNGVLKVTLPKRPEAAPRQIEIKGENGAAKQIKAK